MKNKSTTDKEPSLAELVLKARENDRAIAATNTEAAKKAGQAVKEVLDEKNVNGKRQRKNLIAPNQPNAGNGTGSNK